MVVVIKVPASLAYLFQGERVVQCSANNIKSCINILDARFPGLKKKLCDEKGDLLDVFNIYVNGINIHYLREMETPLHDDDEVGIIPAAAAG